MFNTLRRWLAPETPKKQSRRPLRLEPLEDRLTPAITVTQLGNPSNAIFEDAGAGPTVNGQTGVTNTNRPVNGAINSILVNPLNNDIAYASTVAGGIWRTTNFTADPDQIVWEALNDRALTLFSGGSSFDPNDPTFSTIYVGTGSSSSAGTNPNGANRGLFRITNANDPDINNVVVTNLSPTLPGQIEAVAISRTNPNVILVAGSGGLRRSLNGGTSFTSLAGVGGLPGAIGSVTDVIIDPNRPNTFYAALIDQGIWRSDNGGSNWTRIDSNTPGITKPIVRPTTDPNYLGDARVRMSIHDMGNLSVLYVAYNSFFFGQGAITESVWRYEEDGIDSNFNGVVDEANESSWFRMGTVPNVNRGGQGTIHFSFQADARDKNVVYIGGDSSPNTFGNLARGTFTGANGFLVPTLDTASWTSLNPGGSQPHADSRDMFLLTPTDPTLPQTLVEVSDGGVYRLVNPDNPSGTGTETWISVGNGIRNFEYYNAAYDTKNDVIIGAAQDNGTQLQLAANNPAFTLLQGGDGATVEYSAAGDIRYALGNNFGFFNRQVSGGPLTQLRLSTTPTGALFDGLENTSGGATDRQYTGGFEGPKPIAANAILPDSVMLGRRALYESATRGDGIAMVIGPTGVAGEKLPDEEFQTIVYGGMRNLTPLPQVFYAGTDLGCLYFRDVDSNGGTQIFVRTAALTAAIPGFLSIQKIIVDPSDYRRVYVLKGNQVAFSSNGGMSFTNITGNLGTLVGGVGLTSMALIDSTPNAPGDGLLVVGGLGALFSLRIQNLPATTWTTFGTGLPNVLVSDLEFVPDNDPPDTDSNTNDAIDGEGILLISTLGRGAFILRNAEEFALNRVLITVTGNASANTLRLSESQTTLDQIVVEDGLGNVQAFNKNLVGGVRFIGQGGNDTIVIDSNANAAGGRINFFDFFVDVDGGGQAGDTLLLNDVDNAFDTVTTFAGGTINGGTNDNLLPTGASISFANIAAINLNSGIGFDRILVNDPTVRLNLNTGEGDDVVNFSGSTTTPNVTVNGGTGSNTIVGLNSISNTFQIQNGSSGNLNGVVNFTNVNNHFGGSQNDFATYQGSAANEDIVVTFSAASFAGTITGLATNGNGYAALENLTINGGGGTNNVTISDGSQLVYGTALNPETGLNIAPTGANSASFFSVGNRLSNIKFNDVNGNFVIFGDDNGSGDRDVVNILGISSIGAPGAGSHFELMTPNGSDTINVTENLVSISNANLGQLRGVSLGFINGAPTVSTLYVQGGQELGQAGDTVIATTSLNTNIVIDGGAPSARPGDRLQVIAVGQTQSGRVNDPNLGPPQIRVKGENGADLGYLNFESINTGSGGAAGSSARYATSLDAGGLPVVRIYNSVTNAPIVDIFAYDPGFLGGVKIAMADVNNDGTPDLITGTGVGSPPHVKVFDGLTFQEIFSFFAYDPSLQTGVNVAAGDVDGDGFADIITGVAGNAPSHVKVFSGATGAEIRSFYAYDPRSLVGVSVAAGDFNNDGMSDIVTGAGPGAGSHVKVFDSATGREVRSFFAFDPSALTGVFVATGDVNGDGVVDIITSPAQTSTPFVIVLDGVTNQTIFGFFVNQNFAPSAVSSVPVQQGVRVASTDIDGDGIAEIIVGKGSPGDLPRVFIYKTVPSFNPVIDFLIFEGSFAGGIFVAGA
jgi:hypothetical protein